jgi:hypothetical protein
MIPAHLLTVRKPYSGFLVSLLAMTTALQAQPQASAAHGSQNPAGSCCGEDSKILDLEEITSHPKTFRDKTVRLQGRITNAGKNYFTDRRLVFKDKTGKAVPVASTIPLEALPPPPATGDDQLPQTLAQVLDTDVEITAVVNSQNKSGTQTISLRIVCVRRLGSKR